MNAAARAVVTELPDITIAYGVSDEYRYEMFGHIPLVCLLLKGYSSFVFHKTCLLFERRAR